MSHDFLPRREAELLAWSRNLRDCINESPSHCGLSAQEANEYHAQHETFAELYETSQHAAQRTPVVVQRKNEAKRSLVALARQVARQIQSMPETTDALREQLGLTVRAKKAKRIARPSEPPMIEVVGTDNYRVRVRLYPSMRLRSGKPDGVQGASIFSYVGDTPPVDIGQWTFERNTTRATCEVDVTCSTDRVARVWLSARWYNPRGECGPAAQPVPVVVVRTMSVAA